MSEKFVLPQLIARSDRQFWKSWKLVCLGGFLLALFLGGWLPAPFPVIGYLMGLAFSVHLLFYLGRRLKNFLLWRVRNRIAGSFIFVGLIPLLLFAGTVVLLGYILLGQMAGSYLRSSLQEMQHELSLISVALEARLSDGRSAIPFPEAAAEAHRKNREKFPRLSIRLIATRQDGTVKPLEVYDPATLVADFNKYLPAMEWEGKEELEGLLRLEKNTLLLSVRPFDRLENARLEVCAPLDAHIENRLAKEKSIYTIFLGPSTPRLTIRKGKAERESGDRVRTRDPQFEKRLSEMEQRRAQDARQMVYGNPSTRVRGWSQQSGKEESLAHALLAVPVEVIFTEYFAQYRSSGHYLLMAFYILFGFFLGAELISVFIGILISRGVTRSVDDLYKGTLALQRGDLHHQIPIRRHDQLGMLAHSFNQMTASISHLLSEVTEKKRLEHELEIAREVQATLFPKILPRPRGFCIFGGCEPARTVSGDYYDFIVEDDARIHLAVGDISGKGISAALLMASLQAAMRNQLMSVRQNRVGDVPRGLIEVMQQLNLQLYQNSPSEKYATLFVGRFDAETRQLCYCNAGHPPPILFRNGSICRLNTDDTVIGLLEHTSFHARTVEMTPGSVLAIFSDGVTEAMNEQEEEYGEERLIEVISGARPLSPEMIYSQVIRRVQQWQGASRQHDDITLIIGKVD